MTISKQTSYEVEIEDVEYLLHVDAPLLARLFKPQGNGPFPVMVELHGGAWVRGTRENGDMANEALARGILDYIVEHPGTPSEDVPQSVFSQEMKDRLAPFR